MVLTRRIKWPRTAVFQFAVRTIAPNRWFLQLSRLDRPALLNSQLCFNTIARFSPPKFHCDNSNPLTMASAPAYTPLEDRPLKDTICLFDVDGTLTPARLVRTPCLPLPHLTALSHSSLT